jgi:hypothetical protein
LEDNVTAGSTYNPVTGYCHDDSFSNRLHSPSLIIFDRIFLAVYIFVMIRNVLEDIRREYFN